MTEALIDRAHAAWRRVKEEAGIDLPVQVTLIETDGRIVLVAAALEAERDEVMRGLGLAAATRYGIVVGIDGWRIRPDERPEPDQYPPGTLGAMAAAGDERVDSVLTTIVFTDGRMIARHQTYRPVGAEVTWGDIEDEDWGAEEDWADDDRVAMGEVQRRIYVGHKAAGEVGRRLGLGSCAAVLGTLGWTLFAGVDLSGPLRGPVPR